MSTAPGTVEAGNSTTISFTAYDQFGNIATGFTDAVTPNSTDPLASYGSVTLANGIGSFSASLFTVGSGTQTVSITDSVHPSVGSATTGPISVTPNVETHFSVGAIRAISRRAASRLCRSRPSTRTATPPPATAGR